MIDSKPTDNKTQTKTGRLRKTWEHFKRNKFKYYFGVATIMLAVFPPAGATMLICGPILYAVGYAAKEILKEIGSAMLAVGFSAVKSIMSVARTIAEVGQDLADAARDVASGVRSIRDSIMNWWNRKTKDTTPLPPTTKPTTPPTVESTKTIKAPHTPSPTRTDQKSLSR